MADALNFLTKRLISLDLLLSKFSKNFFAEIRLERLNYVLEEKIDDKINLRLGFQFNRPIFLLAFEIESTIIPFRSVAINLKNKLSNLK